MLPRPLRILVRWMLRQTFRYKRRRLSPTDYLAEFDHSSLRRARASILWFEDWNAATEHHIKILDQFGLVADGFRVVDFGCGIGRLTEAILRSHSVHITAVDRSREMRRHASRYISNEHFKTGVVVLLSDEEFLRRLGTMHGTTDTILFVEVLQHIPEPTIDKILPLILTALKPRGRVFVFGNDQLDVAADGGTYPDTPTVESVLDRHMRILKRDVWLQGFSATRYSFLCEVGGGDDGADHSAAVRLDSNP